MWALAFKPETDDVREAPACMLVGDMLAAGAHVRAYDPMAMPNAYALLAARLSPAEMDCLTLTPHADEALAGAECARAGDRVEEIQQP